MGELKKSLLLFCTLYCLSFSLSGQNVEYGLTVITHGYQAGSTAPINSSDSDAWAYLMAESILSRAQRGEIRRYDKAAGKYSLIRKKGSGGEVILLFDWAKESSWNYQGYSEAAADALFNSLLLSSKAGSFNLSKIHFIGHSRGTVVNTLAVERLLVLEKNYPGTYQITIDQVTNIDPHDWGFLGVGNDLNDAHSDIIIDIPADNRPNNGTIAWEGVFSDTYYQKNPPMIGEVNLTGRPVMGSMSFLWNQNDQGKLLKHGEIDFGIHHEGYTRTIKHGIDIQGENGAAGGYNLSRISNGIAKRPKEIYGSSNTTFDFYTRRSNRVIGILNGSFDRGSDSNIPGWEEHGGATGAAIAQGGFIRFSSTTGKSIRHNRFYIPPDATYITFELHAERIATPVFMTASIGNQEVFSEEIDFVTQGYEKKKIDVKNFRNKVVTLELAVKAPAGSFISTQIAIDNVELSNEAESLTTSLFLIDLSGSMNGFGGNPAKTKLQQAKDAASYTLDAMVGGPPQAVGVLGFSGGCPGPGGDPTTGNANFTTDVAAAKNVIANFGAGGGTPLLEAIAVAKCKLATELSANQQASGKLIVLSDGQATCGTIRPPGVYQNTAPLQQTQIDVLAGQCGAPASAPIKYYTVGFNIAPGSPAERDLQFLAQASGGKYLNVQSQTQLERAFRKFNRTYLPKPRPALGNLPTTAVDGFLTGVRDIRSERFDAALAGYESFVQQHPEDCHGVYNLALMQEALDLYPGAIANYRRYLSLCPAAPDRAQVEKQIELLERDFQQFKQFQREVVRSDLAYLELHFQKIQNGESIALAAEFKGFITEKGSYYRRLPAMLGENSRGLRSLAADVADGLDQCSGLIRRRPQQWDQNAIPLISMMYLTLEDLSSLL